MSLELLASHTGGVAVDDTQEVGHGNVVRGRVAVGGCPVEHKTLADGMPLFGFVFLLRILFLDIIELLALEFVLVFSLLGGARHPGPNGTKEVGGVHHRCTGGRCCRKAWKDVIPVEACAPC